MIDLHWPPHHWPDGGAGVGHVHHPANHWPTAEDGVAPPTTTLGVGVFELALEGQATVTYAWATAIEKHRDGKERRASLVDDPGVRYEGEALLMGPPDSRGDQARAMRSKLAQFAALGQPFSLGLPYEALALRADSTGTTIAVFAGPLSRADWAVIGGRVLVQHRTHGSRTAVIQSVGADTIEVAVDGAATLGSVGLPGAFVMPIVPVFLDSQQSWERYQPEEPIERWPLRARNADAGAVRSSATPARLVLGGTLDGLVLEARTAGDTSITFEMQSGGIAEFLQFNLGDDIKASFQEGVADVNDFLLGMASNDLVRVTGTLVGNTTDILQLSDVVYPAQPLTGGTDAEYAEVGLGAALTEYRDSPVWDRGIVVNGTVSDSIQAMTEILDLGGLPFATQTAEVPDWGRAIVMRDRLGPEFQWLKKMLWAIRGRWKSFWLSTSRADIVPVSSAAGTLTVSDSDAAGAVRTWYPAHRRDLLVRTSTGTSYVRIAAALDNGDETTTLSIVNEDGDPVTLSGDLEAVSWLELVHLESDEVPVTFSERAFSVGLLARVVQR